MEQADLPPGHVTNFAELMAASLCMQAMRDIVGKCLIKDASKRPSAAQLLEHKFFKVSLV